MSVHRIRLAGPWHWQTSEDMSQPLPEATQTRTIFDTGRTSELWHECRLPFEVPDCGDTEIVKLRRRFHRPTGIVESTQLHIALQTADLEVSLLVNGVNLTKDPESLKCHNSSGSKNSAEDSSVPSTVTRDRRMQEHRVEISHRLSNFNELLVSARRLSGEVPGLVLAAFLDITSD